MATVGCLGLVLGAGACGDDEAAEVRTPDELLGALLTVEDVAFIPAESEENMRSVIESPAPPYEGTLDPYLCTEAGTPEALTTPQAQLELTGSGVMEILLAAEDADNLYQELDAAYQACGSDSSLPYEPLSEAPSVGDESSSYRSDLGVVTIARFDTTVMILKWMIGSFYDEGIGYYPELVTTAADNVTGL